MDVSVPARDALKLINAREDHRAMKQNLRTTGFPTKDHNLGRYGKPIGWISDVVENGGICLKAIYLATHHGSVNGLWTRKKG